VSLLQHRSARFLPCSAGRLSVSASWRISPIDLHREVAHIGLVTQSGTDFAPFRHQNAARPGAPSFAVRLPAAEVRLMRSMQLTP
jgi:hypothetical protein